MKMSSITLKAPAMHSLPHSASMVVADSGMILMLEMFGSFIWLRSKTKCDSKFSPEAEEPPQRQEGDDRQLAAVGLDGVEDGEHGGELHEPAERRAKVDAGAHVARRQGQPVVGAAHHKPAIELETNLREV